MSQKIKGTNAERDLVHLFWSAKWAAIRVAGSGSSKYPSPDVIASNNIRKLAIECKTTKKTSQYFEKKEIQELKLFAETFGAEAYVAIRFPKQPWLFIILEDLNELPKSHSISLKKAQNRGLTFEEVIQKPL